MATEAHPSNVPSIWMGAKYRIMIAGTSLMGLVGMASAAIDFSNISALIQAVTGLIPDFVQLVIEMAPLLVTIAIISFIVAFFDKILAMLKLG